MITEEFIQIKAHNSTRKWYIKKGYKVPSPGKLFTVKISDLPEKSGIKVPFICDFCGDPDEKAYGNLINKEPHACKKCVNKKIDQTFQKNFNTEEKRKDLQRRREDTFAKNHDGHRTPFHIPEVVKKAQDTREELYGCKTYFGVMNEEERHDSQVKCAETRFINGTTKTSKNQIHLCNLLNGILNKNIDTYNADILLDNNVIIEYDGFGHFFYDDYFKRDSSKCEEKRTNIILNKGYKIIRIICKNDILPEDNVILKLIKYAKQFDFTIIDCENQLILHDNQETLFKTIL